MKIEIASFRTSAVLMSILCSLLIPQITCSQTNYFVSPDGNNANTGGLQMPWKTVQYGLDELTSGDTLNLMSGTYNEKVEIPISGIVLRNHASDMPRIDASGLFNQISVIEIHDVSNVTISGIEIANNVMIDAQGILVEGNCQNITIQKCKIHDIHFSSNPNATVDYDTNAQGIIVYGTDGNNAITNLQILNNELFDCRLGASEGIAVNGNVDGFVISGNEVHDLTNIGIDAIGFEGESSNAASDQARNGLISNNMVYNCLSGLATSAGIYIDGGKSIVVENNTCYHNGYGIEVGCENQGKATEDIVVRNNLIYDNEVAGLAFGGFDFPDESGKVINSSFRNNTCFYNDYTEEYNGEMYLSYTENCVIENNIFYVSDQNVALFQDGNPLNLSMDYNVYYSDVMASQIMFDYAGIPGNGLVDFSSKTGQDKNSINQNPAFVNASTATPDFHLTPASPAIDAGNPAFIGGVGEMDLDGENRVNGTVDCGADEHYMTTGLGVFVKSEIHLYPNPTRGVVNVISDFEHLTFKVIGPSGMVFMAGMSANSQIDFSSLSPGMYFVHLYNPSGVVGWTTKIVRE